MSVEIYYILILEFLVYIFQISFFFPFMEGKDMGEICELIGKIKRNKDAPALVKKIGQTTYIVRVHFSKTSKETMSDKIKRMLKNEIQQM